MITSVDEVFRSYLDPAFRYVWSQSPARVRSREDALRDGLNCVALAHLVLRDLFGHVLPASYQSLELFQDRRYFEPVDDLARSRAGDLVWFGVAEPRLPLDEFVPLFEDGELLNVADFPVNHVAVHTGEHLGGDPLLLHASSLDGTNALWPLRRFADHPRYGRIYGVHRLRASFRPVRSVVEQP
jgi:hypothetical protein